MGSLAVELAYPPTRGKPMIQLMYLFLISGLIALMNIAYIQSRLEDISDFVEEEDGPSIYNITDEELQELRRSHDELMSIPVKTDEQLHRKMDSLIFLMRVEREKSKVDREKRKEMFKELHSNISTLLSEKTND
jgi:hypothetical protein